MTSAAWSTFPVNDRFSLRAQAAYLHEDGYVRRGTQNLGGSEDKLARLQAAFDVTDNVKITLGGLYSNVGDRMARPNVFETFDMAPGIIQGNFADWLSDALAGVPASRGWRPSTIRASCAARAAIRTSA